MAVRPWLSKSEFMKKYAKSKATYVRRIQELRDTPEFSAAYIAPTNQEIWIDEEIYQNFLIWKSENKFK